MAKVFGAEGSDFVSEEKKKNGSYLGKKRKGRDSFVSEWKRRKRLCLCKRILCYVGVSAKKKAGESKDSLAFLNFAIIRW